MTDMYKGTIVEESLIDNSIINDFEVINSKISNDENPANRWHLYTVSITYEAIERLSDNIKPKWYMHFWKDKNVIVIFHGKRFEFNYDDKKSWSPAVEYGIEMGIPKEQLDFLID
ncbi:MAG: hypothetical protein WC070_00500 [Candidatus Magasanikbacteria bacterium]